MNWFDYIILVVLIYGGYKGFSKGFIIELASLVALLLALYGGVYFSDQMSHYLSTNHALISEYLPVISFSLLFLLIMVSVFSVAKLLELVLKITGLSFINKSFGLLFGMLKYFLFLSFMLFIIHAANSKIKLYSSENNIYQSLSYNKMIALSSFCIRITGSEKKILKDFSNKFVKPEEIKDLLD